MRIVKVIAAVAMSVLMLPLALTACAGYDNGYNIEQGTAEGKTAVRLYRSNVEVNGKKCVAFTSAAGSVSVVCP